MCIKRHRILLGDDGTMDTVVYCADCGEEERGSYDGEGGYSAFVQSLIRDVRDEHCCCSEDQEGEENHEHKVRAPKPGQ